MGNSVLYKNNINFVFWGGFLSKSIKSFVGGHSVKIFRNCEYDEKIRKYRGGELVLEIPYSGKLLNATVVQSEAESIEYNGVPIPTKSPQKFTDVDDIPSEEECDFCVVSALYVTACKELGVDTSRLLTIGAPVVNEEGYVVGTVALNRN